MFQFSHAKIFPVFFCFYHHHCYIIYITNVLDNNNNQKNRIEHTRKWYKHVDIQSNTGGAVLFLLFFFRRIPQILNQVQLCSKNIVCVYPLPYISTLYNICTYSTSFQGLSRDEFQIFQLFYSTESMCCLINKIETLSMKNDLSRIYDTENQSLRTEQLQYFIQQKLYVVECS